MLQDTPLSLSDAIAEDGRALRDVCTLLKAAVAPAEWPRPLLEALRVALNPAPGQRRETAKAARLARHLFGAMPQPHFESADLPVARVADRLRADLTDLVPFGAGFFLIDYDEEAGRWAAPNTSR